MAIVLCHFVTEVNFITIDTYSVFTAYKYVFVNYRQLHDTIEFDDINMRHPRIFGDRGYLLFIVYDLKFLTYSATIISSINPS